MARKIRDLLAMTAAFISLAAFAAGGDAELEKAEIDPDNISSLQRGARNFVNYCSGCHSAKYVRFKTIGKYLELTEEQLIDNLMFNADKTFETMNVSMRPGDAERWFGTAPPDLSLMARSSGADYIYNFLQSFYIDGQPDRCGQHYPGRHQHAARTMGVAGLSESYLQLARRRGRQHYRTLRRLRTCNRGFDGR